MGDKAMNTEKYNLWDETPGMSEEIPTVTVHIPEK